MAVETDRLIVVFEAQVKQFERAVRSLQTTTANEFKKLRATVDQQERSLSNRLRSTGTNMGKGLVQGFGLGIGGRGGLAGAAAAAFGAFTARSVKAAADAGHAASQVWLKTWQDAFNQFSVAYGKAVSDIAIGVLGTEDQQTAVETMEKRKQIELRRTTELIKDQYDLYFGKKGDGSTPRLTRELKEGRLDIPAVEKPEQISEAARENENAREQLRKYIDALEDEAQASELTGLAKEKLLALQRAGPTATAAERDYIEQLTEEIYENEAAIKAQAEALKEAEERAKEQAKALEDVYRDLTGAAEDFTTSLVTGLAEGGKAADVLKAALQDLGRMLIQLGIRTAFSAAGGGAGLPGFQHGGQFTVGGAGGPDSQLVAFRATPGERVSVHPPGMAQPRGGVGGIHMGGISVTVAGSADERTLAIMERRIRQAQAQQIKVIERNFGGLQSRYSSLRG